jgi:hypothetical protein
MKEAVPHFGVAPSHRAAVANCCHHLVLVGVNHQFKFDAEILEGPPGLAQHCVCGFDSPEDPGGGGLRCVDFIVGVEVLSRSLQTGGNPFVDLADDLHVLLRHRPRSISRLPGGGSEARDAIPTTAPVSFLQEKGPEKWPTSTTSTQAPVPG